MTAPVTSIAMLAVAAVSAAGAVGMLLAFVYGLGRSDANAAREEAIALAATRAELIRDLKARLEALEHACQIQRIATLVLVELLADVKRDIEAAPPHVDLALARIEEFAADAPAGVENPDARGGLLCRRRVR
jgi:hypothetical protein